MKTVTLEQAVSDLREMIKDALHSKEAITIATEDGAVTILPEEEYTSMQETLKLLGDKKSLNALLTSHQDRDSGYIAESYSVEDVFDDLQD
jgi:PHD/YefM family antitoxin component YafN of YafNO toxin-antitoxin module